MVRGSLRHNRATSRLWGIRPTRTKPASRRWRAATWWRWRVHDAVREMVVRLDHAGVRAAAERVDLAALVEATGGTPVQLVTREYVGTDRQENQLHRDRRGQPGAGLRVFQ